MTPPRILYVSPFWPSQTGSAAELRAINVARALGGFGTVEVAVLDEGRGLDADTRPESQEFKVPFTCKADLKPNRTLAEKVAWTMNPRTPNPNGKGVSKESMEQLARLASDYDLIWFCKLTTANAFPRWAWPASVVDIDDVPSTYHQSVWETSRHLPEKLMAAKNLYSWRRREKLLGERFSVFGVCSEVDKRYLDGLGTGAPVHVMPNGFDKPAGEPGRNPASPPRIGFIGVFDHEANVEGLHWFARECWPRIKRELPDARLRLVGRGSDGPLKPEGPDIDALGFVDDPAGEIATWGAMAVPILVGAGTRGKIAHAFSLKCPVVSTNLGAYGYDAIDGREMFLADSAEDFAHACVRAVRAPAEAEAVAERAWKHFLDHLTWDAIRPRICAAAEDCLRRNATGSP